MCSPLAYSVPHEAEVVFHRGILENPLMQHLPTCLTELSRLVHFEGNALPSIPVNWRWAESISALKALEATMLNYLLTSKYEIPPVEVTINTYVFFVFQELLNDDNGGVPTKRQKFNYSI